ncbi:cytidine deaminase-like protein [Colletotrichum navitas]|uniref:Cytidine deaminase-like protein n=1 Tax=Colletotrichum navitas TaxID=681940 RepID=A0AAD8PVU1_9PEZI|nr:cytidine deaminase-like protein [Colletotrichum navitas]KAK1585605.1 cytidine deaminase-like protein [Colletotrichum navitas]
MLRSTVFLTLGLLGLSRAHFVIHNDDQDMSGLTVNSIPAEKRVEYMRKTNEALFRQSGPCPFAAFGAIIVNHTSDEVVCEGANFRTGDPTIHGEISAINACTARFAEQGMTPTDIFAAWGDLSIYTNAESCPMVLLSPANSTWDLTADISPQCASAIRWAGFKEYVYGTTIQHNYNVGWGVMTLSSYDVFQQSRQLPGHQTVMIGQILANETDPLFSWQYNASAPCPNECFRVPSAARGGSTCSNVTVSRRDYEGL